MNPTQVLGIARRALIEVKDLPLYASKTGPKDYTLPQLYVFLELGRRLRIPSLRKLADRLKGWPELLEELNVERPPSFMALWRAARWLEENPRSRWSGVGVHYRPLVV